MTHSTLLSVDGLTVAYGGVTAVDAVTFAVPEAQVTGLIGPNGAGKTSLIDALTGYTRPAAGRVLLDGTDITRRPAYWRARQGLTRTFQSVELFDDLTVRENLLTARERTAAAAFGSLTRRRAKASDHAADVARALELTGLEAVADRYPAQLALGRRKLVGVARALASRPRLVLLDEPAAGLDSDESQEFGARLRLLAHDGVGVLLVDHDMGLVLSTCDQVMVLDFGRLIAAGPADEIRRDPVVISAYLGSEAAV
ncbi:ABC transporter ATP-binding protein [Streptomyces griseorubiginosus]|uniref:ABC transporter ATP-binding protein n=1 Tax=Streptomyces griseorubiginosus TaxID=67304 RepID=UPI00364E00F4